MAQNSDVVLASGVVDKNYRRSFSGQQTKWHQLEMSSLVSSDHGCGVMVMKDESKTKGGRDSKSAR